MKQNGFYTATIAVIVLVLAASMMTMLASSEKTKQAESYQRAVFELQWAMQNTQYLLDKTLADNMADQARTSCEIPGSYPTIQTYFNNTINQAKTSFNITPCNVTVTLAGTNNVTTTTVVSCTKSVGAFSVTMTKTFNFDKTITTAPGSPCMIAVKDNQSGSCDVLEGGATCP